jgi:hypothetical protein
MTRAPYRCAVGLMIKTDEVSEQGWNALCPQALAEEAAGLILVAGGPPLLDGSHIPPALHGAHEGPGVPRKLLRARPLGLPHAPSSCGGRAMAVVSLTPSRGSCAPVGQLKRRRFSCLSRVGPSCSHAVSDTPRQPFVHPCPLAGPAWRPRGPVAPLARSNGPGSRRQTRAASVPGS